MHKKHLPFSEDSIGQPKKLIVVPRKLINTLSKDKTEFVRILKEPTINMLSKGKLSGGACKLLLYLIANSDVSMPIKKGEMSTNLGWGRNGRKISKFMNELLDNGVILKKNHPYFY